MAHMTAVQIPRPGGAFEVVQRDVPVLSVLDLIVVHPTAGMQQQPHAAAGGDDFLRIHFHGPGRHRLAGRTSARMAMGNARVIRINNWNESRPRNAKRASA